jgi:hypothetical protein
MDTLATPMGRRGLLGMLLAGVGLAATARVAAAVEVGEKAPDFSLPATTGGKISLSQFQGKQLVLIEFFVADFAPT